MSEKEVLKNELFNKSEEAATELVEPKREIKYRHPQQVLTPKEVEILLSKKEEDLNELDKIAIKWLALRVKHHNSNPKILTLKERKKRKAKRAISNKSRKVNR